MVVAAHNNFNMTIFRIIMLLRVAEVFEYNSVLMQCIMHKFNCDTFNSDVVARNIHFTLPTYNIRYGTYF